MLRELACSHCGGAGLQLQPDGSAVCRFCGSPNQLTGPVCPRCETVNRASAEQCVHCRQALTRACPTCRVTNWSGADHCANCGRPLDALDTVIDRWRETTADRLDRQQREAAFIKAEEATAAEHRRAYFEEIERRRQQELAEARVRAARERRLLAIGLGVLLIACALIVVVIAWSGLAQ